MHALSAPSGGAASSAAAGVSSSQTNDTEDEAAGAAAIRAAGVSEEVPADVVGRAVDQAEASESGRVESGLRASVKKLKKKVQ